ncbi:MAG: Negative regulator of flagellin synthesis [Candidatus Poribacteria bacterium]|nr:Negative regulator of flagellin synthesis [Candidatus Poribacteria bacterium]
MGRKRKSDVISPDPAEVQRFKEIAKGIPDVRQEKVDEIKRKIEAGEYKVNADAVAGKMIELAQDLKKMTPKIKTNK